MMYMQISGFIRDEPHEIYCMWNIPGEKVMIMANIMDNIMHVSIMVCNDVLLLSHFLHM
jgi:hypothetical protein